MALFRLNIVWDDDSKNTLVYKYPFKNMGREVNDKSTLTVKESQVAIFVYKGQVTDIFGPGLYNLKTQIFPILTKLAAWKYAFETPITLDVYYVNTKQFTDIKWGTKNPIIMRDPEFGAVRVRGFGSFAFKVDDPSIFLKELFGTNSSFRTDDITEYLKTMVLSSMADALGESGISVLDLAANTMEFNDIIRLKIQAKFREIGLEMTNLFIENMSVPKEVEEALDKKSTLGILKNDTDTLMKISAAEAMKEAAKNPGAGGAFFGAGVGMGAGMGVGGMMASAFAPTAPTATPTATTAPTSTGATITCVSCGKNIASGSKFCPDCGAKQPTVAFCPNCGTKVSGGKFCSSCGHKL